MCVAMNDLEYVRRSLTLIPDEVNLESVLEAVEAAAEASCGQDRGQWRAALSSFMDHSTNQLEADIMMIITRLGVKVGCTCINRQFQHL